MSEQRLEQAHRARQRDDFDALLQGLEERGLPGGAWLVELGRVRQALREADTLLRRLEDAIIRSAEPQRGR